MDYVVNTALQQGTPSSSSSSSMLSSVLPSSASEVLMACTMPHAFAAKKGMALFTSLFMSSGVAYLTMGYAAKVLFSAYGDRLLSSNVVHSVGKQFGNLMMRGSSSSTAAPSSLVASGGGGGGPSLSGMLRQLYASVLHDDDDAPNNHNNKRRESLGVTLALLGMLLTYLHTVGAYEMRAQLRRNAKPAASPHYHHQEEKEAKTPASSRREDGADVHYATRAKLQALLLHHFGDDEAAPPRQPAAAAGGLWLDDDDSLLTQVIRRQYEGQRFYQPPPQCREADRRRPKRPAAVDEDDEDDDDEGLLAYFLSTRPTNVNVVRLVFNTLVGLILQLNALIGLPSSSHAATASSDGYTAAQYAARVSSFVCYWEVLMHLLRQHGWAPMYVAVRQVVALLSPVR
jgi:hypothetical protein